MEDRMHSHPPSLAQPQQTLYPYVQSSPYFEWPKEALRIFHHAGTLLSPVTLLKCQSLHPAKEAGLGRAGTGGLWGYVLGTAQAALC